MTTTQQIAARPSVWNLGAIQRVSYYQASPVHACDRCGQGIKHVFSVLFRDGLRQEYGIECINRVLDNEPSMRKLFAKNSKLLQKRQRALRALSMPDDQMPRGREYFNSGLYFVADESGEDVMAETHWFFHPVYDTEKNQGGEHYVVRNDAERLSKVRAEIERGKVWLVKDIERLEMFLARVIAHAAKQARVAGSQPALEGVALRDGESDARALQAHQTEASHD